MEMSTDIFIKQLQRKNQASQALLKIAEKNGLVIIDADTDAVTATKWSLLTSPPVD